MMAIVTRERRERLHRCLATLRHHLERTGAPGEMLGAVDEIGAEIECRREGFVFEEVPEECEAVLATAEPTLEEVSELRLGPDGEANWLIEGENLLALTALGRLLRGRVDVVCADPPYNTGMSTLGYADHLASDLRGRPARGPWLSFMKKRLDLVRPLLSERGVVFIHVDEREISVLVLLCEDLFGAENVDVLIWPKTDPRFDRNRVERPFHNIKVVHEYIVVCYRDRAGTTLGKMRDPSGGSYPGLRDLESIVAGLGTTSSAKDELAVVFGNRDRFRTPKPMLLVRELVRVASNTGSVVLDIFAGSGTTGHAVMDLNHEDGGCRRFVLVTSSESGICRDVAYRRLKTAIAREGYAASLHYHVLATG